MERSLIKQVNKKNMAARLNTRHVKPVVFPNFFGVKRKTSLKWETLTGEKGAPVMADVISFDASAPQKTREVISKLSGDIPKTAVKRGMNESDYNEYKQLERDAQGDADQLALLNLAFKDQDFVYNSVRARFEWWCMQLMSRAGFHLSAKNNGGVVTAEFVGCGMPKKNQRKSSVDWSNASTANGLQEISKIRLLLLLPRECKEILVLEEGYPVVEEQLKGFLGIGIQVHGRLDGTLQRDGELTPDAVGKALGKRIESYYATPEVVEQRPPALCQGCGHRDMYEALNEVLAGYKGAKVFGDIGCYTLGALPPFRAIDTCIDMGASITMAKGASDAGVYPAVSVIGDSTFTHSGMTGLLDCVNENTNITIVISDNETTAMTGGQDSAGTGRIESICAGIGVDPAHIRVMVPLKKNYDEMKAIIREEIEYKGVSVLIPRRECIQTLTRKKKASRK